MNRVRRQRLLVLIAVLTGIAITVGLALYGLRQNINLFYSPAEVVDGTAPVGQKMRVGGLVVKGSVRHDLKTLDVVFKLTDGDGTFTVFYHGILPDLFREGQGIVANGVLVSRHRFKATQVLAKHDATYMPPGVKEALKKSGHLRNQQQITQPTNPVTSVQ